MRWSTSVSSPARRATASNRSKRCAPTRKNTALIKFAWLSSAPTTRKRSRFWRAIYCRPSCDKGFVGSDADTVSVRKGNLHGQNECADDADENGSRGRSRVIYPTHV